MTRTAWLRAFVFLLMLALAAPAVAVAGGGERPPKPDLAAALWEALVRLLPAIENLGAGLDPAGTSGQASAADEPATDLGPGLDPGGTPNG